MFERGKTKIGARALAMLSDRQQAIIAEVAKDISATLAEWIAGQFIAGRTPDEVWKQLSAARGVAEPVAAPSQWIARSAYNGHQIAKYDHIRHNTLGPVVFEGCTSDGMLIIIRPDNTKGEFLPTAFQGITLVRDL